MTPTYFLETERLGFRHWRPDDVDLAMALWGDPEVARFIHAGGVPSPAAVKERLGREIACQVEHGFQYWPIFLLEDGRHVGCCGLRPYRPEERVHELGVHIRPAFWRRGLALEAAGAVIRRAFERLGARGLFAGHNPANAASRQMILKLGFRYTHDELYPPTGLEHPSYLLARPERDPLLDEQIAYYRAVAGEYEDHAIAEAGAGELGAALERFRAEGDVLELACGPGTWTERLLEHARSLTAVDASPEMIARAKARVGDRVRFIQSDLFSWTPDRRYDVVFFGFWLSHVPMDRFDRFWSLVDRCLVPAGRVLFLDDNHRTAAELIEGEDSSTVERRLHDGTAHRAIKVPHRPADLEERLRRLGWRIAVTPTAGPFYWGAGTRLGS